MEEAWSPEEVARLRPQVPDWLAWIWEAFHRLSCERPYRVTGIAAPMGVMKIEGIPGRIPWTAVDAWARRHGYGRDRLSFLDRVLGEMDDEFLAWHAERRAA